MKASFAILPLALAGYASAAAVSMGSSCSDLWNEAPKLLSNLSVYVAQDYPDGTNFTTNYSTPAYPKPVPNLPAFCRFGGYIHTSNISKVQFEVWLPTAANWSGRFAMVGNGGDAGGVNFPDMWAPISKYGFAVASTDAGHNGTSGDDTFAINNTETQIDFGHRAVHLTTVYSKAIVNAYYGKMAKNNYWIGCSSGGKQGVKEVQMYPEDYDGVLAGAAAQWWTHLNAQTYRINAIINPVNSTGHLNASDYATIGRLVLKQCDELDGLKDGLITNPLLCKPDLGPLSCDRPSANTTSCLSAAKIATMQAIWANYYAENGEFLFFGFMPGAEASPAFSVTGSPYGPGPDFFQYQVLNKTTVSAFNVTDNAEFERLIQVADETDPGQTNAINPNISTFLKRGKLMTYVGLADTLIPTGSTIWYHDQVRKALGYPADFDSYYRMFTIPGMGHCSSGPGAWNFGQASQRQLSLGGGAQSLTFDAEHDAVLALIDWVENGKAPDMLVGAKYVGDDKRNGTAFTRPHCVYPKQAVYQGGDANSASSFSCQNLV